MLHLVISEFMLITNKFQYNSKIKRFGWMANEKTIRKLTHIVIPMNFVINFLLMFFFFSSLTFKNFSSYYYIMYRMRFHFGDISFYLLSFSF